MRFWRALSLTLLALWCALWIQPAFAEPAADPASAPAVASRPAFTDTLAGKKLLALYLTALILLLLAVLAMVLTMRIRYKTDAPRERTEMEDLWFLNKPKEDS